METFAQDSYDYDQPTYNAQGQLHGLQKSTYNNKPIYEHRYKDGVIEEAVHYKVAVEGKSPLKGSYKNGKPYQGFFVDAANEMELYLTDYYEEGRLVAQYSRPLMVITEEGDMYIHEDPDMYADDYEDRPTQLTVKTTYQQGKVVDGVQYQFSKLDGNAFLLIMETYQQGKRKYADLLLGAVHYAEHARLVFQNDGYTITTKENEPLGRAGGTLTVRFTGQSGNVTLTPHAGFAFHQAPLSQPLAAQWGHVYYYKQNDAYYYQQNTDIKLTEDHYGSSGGMIHVMFESLMRHAALLSETEANTYADLFSIYQSDVFLVPLFLMKDGVPHTGTWIQPGSKPDTYSYTRYREERILESKTDVAADQVEQLPESRF